MTRALCVGVATLDIVNHVAAYPAEDSEVRALAQSRRMGGNAANTAVILAQLGVETSWVGNLSESSEIDDEAFARHGVDASLAVRIANAILPTSFILLSEATGTRSIVHHRALPEYRAADFRKLDLTAFDWVHFEGRAVDQLGDMLRHARRFPRLTLSLEVEKRRVGIETCFELADVLLFSRAFAQSQGLANAEQLLAGLPGSGVAACAWGEEGAWARDRQGHISHAAAPSLVTPVDTIGAGDVFNAAMIHALASGQRLVQALQSAVALASSTCMQLGLDLAGAGADP